MAAAFLGYVLPWGQMSFWGTTVITNLLSAIPYIGGDVVMWLWGGFAVGNPTLTRFFSFHFILPFIISGLVIIHLLLLHQTGSNNPLGISASSSKVAFSPYFITKDLRGVFTLFSAFFLLVLLFPWLLGDPENFLPANPLVTPIHIQPEWYFLFAYTILRAIPNKLGGVIALVSSVLILLLLPAAHSGHVHPLKNIGPTQTLFWCFSIVFFVLTWIGICPVEEPYITTGQIIAVVYFSYFFFVSAVKTAWASLLSF